MNELCILQDDVPPFPNQVNSSCNTSIVIFPFTVPGLNRPKEVWFGI